MTPANRVVVVGARFGVLDSTAPATAAERLASALMADDRTATVWIHADGRPSRICVDVEADSWDDAATAASSMVCETARGVGLSAEIVLLGGLPDPARLA